MHFLYWSNILLWQYSLIKCYYKHNLLYYLLPTLVKIRYLLWLVITDYISNVCNVSIVLIYIYIKSVIHIKIVKYIKYEYYYFVNV